MVIDWLRWFLACEICSLAISEPHVGVHQVLRSGAAGSVELCQCELRGWQALLDGFLTDGDRCLIVAIAVARIRKRSATSECAGVA